MQSPISPYATFLPPELRRQSSPPSDAAPNPDAAARFARTNELMSVFDRGYRLPDLIREGCSGGHNDLPFLVSSRPHFHYSICMHATCPRDTRPMGCHPFFPVSALTLGQVSILGLGLSIDRRSGSVLLASCHILGTPALVLGECSHHLLCSSLRRSPVQFGSVAAAGDRPTDETITTNLVSLRSRGHP